MLPERFAAFRREVILLLFRNREDLGRLSNESRQSKRGEEDKHAMRKKEMCLNLISD